MWRCARVRLPECWFRACNANTDRQRGVPAASVYIAAGRHTNAWRVANGAYEAHHCVSFAAARALRLCGVFRAAPLRRRTPRRDAVFPGGAIATAQAIDAGGNDPR